MKINYADISNNEKYSISDKQINSIYLNSLKSIINNKIIVLDDDPTGTQTVHSIPVYTLWDYNTIEDILKDKAKLVYILTNSRAFTELETEKMHRQFAKDLVKASKKLKVEFILISRSDSTLRGHYPLETKVLYEEISKAKKIDGEIIMPFFLEGGRFTFNDIHYVKVKDELIPASETEFSKDTTFGYKSSDLKEYIEEKTKGEYKKEDVISISIEELREYKKEDILNKLLKVNDFSKVIVNALEYNDVKVFISILSEAIKSGKNYLFRTAASFVKIIGGIDHKKLLNKQDLYKTQNKDVPGLIVVGSYIKKSTAQFYKLCELDNLIAIPFDVTKVTNDKDFLIEVERVKCSIEKGFIDGKDVCIYTSRGDKREFVSGINEDKESDLKFSVRISEGLVKVVEDLKIKPSFIVAKGGITSSDIGVKALKVKKALVLGQIYPGIPVWQIGNESKFNGIPYRIFPGNVGEEDTLKKVVEKLRVYIRD